MDLEKMKLDDFPLQTYDKIRFCDTDQLGHVNNAIFSSFFETGRVEFLFNPSNPLYSDNCQFVIVELHSSLSNEITWPGTIEIGTVITKIGNSSIKLAQALFQNNQLVATAESVIVQMNASTRKSQALNERTKEILSEYLR
jgi:acyl-CoA thioester hydrolase